jgi:hypothetical protein
MADEVRQLSERIQALEEQLAATRGHRFEKPAVDLRAELAELARRHEVSIQFTALEIASGETVAARCRCICFA